MSAAVSCRACVEKILVVVGAVVLLVVVVVFDFVELSSVELMS